MIAATAFILTTVDPVTVTIFAVVLGAAAVPLPILIVANDARLMGERVNRRWSNAMGTSLRRWPWRLTGGRRPLRAATPS